MMYKSVFFGYIVAAMAVVASGVLVWIMLHQDRQYERKKLLALMGAGISSLCMNTMYFLSYFDSLTTLASLYEPVERALDIVGSYAINTFLITFLYQMGRERVPWAVRLYRPAMIAFSAVYAYACVIYIAVITDEYRAAGGHLLLAEITQVILTLTICTVTGIFTRAAVSRQAEAALKWIPLIMGLVNIVTAVYNCVGSVALFTSRFSYIQWSGAKDMNTWLFLLSAILILLMAEQFFRRCQTAEPDQMSLPPELGLTPREEEIARLVLQRQTYREMAQQLQISEYTVKRHVHNIYEKAGVSRRDDLIRKLS